jgi:hypothetical protein
MRSGSKTPSFGCPAMLLDFVAREKKVRSDARFASAFQPLEDPSRFESGTGAGSGHATPTVEQVP